MADVTIIWREAKGVFQDMGHDRVPAGNVWDLIDYVPEILGAPVRMRGKWNNVNTDALTNIPDGLIYANYKAGARLLAAHGALLADIPVAGGASVAVGAIPATRQSPVQHRDRVIIPAADGLTAAKYVTWNGAAFTLADAPVSAVKGKFGTVFKDRVILGGPDADPSAVGFSKPGDPTTAWDALSLIKTSLALTGLAAQRNQILAFHGGSVERIRGTTPPDSTATDPTGDMILDSLFDKAGCYDARSIAYWNDNVIFADARGVHITDGAIVRNMAAQGGVESKWRRDFAEDTARGAVVTVAGGIYRDFYVVTIRSAAGAPITWICDIPTRKFVRFGNVNSSAYAFSIGLGEKLYAVDATAKKVTDLSAAFKPDDTVLQTDGNGVDVLPVVETGWLRMTNRESYKRFFELLMSYQVVEAADPGIGVPPVLSVDYLHSPEDLAYKNLGGFRYAAAYIRRKLPFRGRFLGAAFRVTQVRPTRDTRIYNLAVRMNEEEENRI